LPGRFSSVARRPTEKNGKTLIGVSQTRVGIRCPVYGRAGQAGSTGMRSKADEVVDGKERWL